MPRALAKPPRALVGFGYRAADGALAHVVGLDIIIDCGCPLYIQVTQKEFRHFMGGAVSTDTASSRRKRHIAASDHSRTPTFADEGAMYIERSVDIRIYLSIVYICSRVCGPS